MKKFSNLIYLINFKKSKFRNFYMMFFTYLLVQKIFTVFQKRKFYYDLMIFALLDFWNSEMFNFWPKGLYTFVQRSLAIFMYVFLPGIKHCFLQCCNVKAFTWFEVLEVLFLKVNSLFENNNMSLICVNLIMSKICRN